MTVEEFAAKHRLRVTKLEDGEVVVPLRGGKKDRYPSNNPHAGLWGEEKWYALLPCKRPGQMADAACAFDWALTYTLADDSVIVFGAPISIIALITKGPNKFRALTTRKVSQATLDNLKKYHFTAQGTRKTG